MDPIAIEKIIRSKRKTIALVITQDAALIVRAPLFTPREYIENLVRKKSAWIKQKIRDVKKRPDLVEKEFVNGEGFLYLGKTYKLQIIEDNLLDIEISDKLCISRRLLPDARNHLKDWYKAEAEKKIIERCAYYTKITGYVPNTVKISNAERRWGSCTSKGTLNFSWRLIMAPLEIIDYVVVHEMIHLNQSDHSKVFWNKIRSILPDYEKRKVWLKENEKLLIL